MRPAVLALFVAGCAPVEPPPPPRPARPPSCVQVADHVPDLVELDAARERRVRDAFHARCSQDRWSPEVRACIAGLRSFSEPRRCKARLTAAQRAAFDRDLAIAMKRGDARGRLPPECAEYARLAERLATCGAVPLHTRNQLERDFRAASATWASPTEEQLAAIAATCRAGVDAVRKACGW